jgi:uncharacterized membrane protein YkvI
MVGGGYATGRELVEFPKLLHPVISVGFMAIAILVADRTGIVGLIGQGYTYATYLFLGIVVVPLLTRGVVLIRNDRRR